MNPLYKLLATLGCLLLLLIPVKGNSQVSTENDLQKLNLKGKVKSVSSYSYDISSTTKDSIDNGYCGTLEETFKHLDDICVQTTEFDRKGNIAKLTRLNTELRENMDVYHYNKAGLLTEVETFMNNGQLLDDGTYDDMHPSEQPKTLVKRLTYIYDATNRVLKEELKGVTAREPEYTTIYSYTEDYPNVKKTTTENDFSTGESYIFFETDQYDEENRLIGIVRQSKDDPSTVTEKFLYNDADVKIGQDEYEGDILSGKQYLIYDNRGNLTEYTTVSLDQFLSRDRETLTLKYKYDRFNNWIRREATHKMKERPDITVVTERKIVYY